MKPPTTVPGNTVGTQRVAGILLAIALSLGGLWVAWPFMPALLWALIAAIAIAPLYAGAEQRWPRLKGTPLAALAVTAIALAILLPLGFGIARAASEAGDVARWIAEARAHGIAVPDWVHALPFGGQTLADWWAASLATPDGAEHLLGQLSDFATFDRSRKLGGEVLHISVEFGFMLVTLFFLLRDGDSIAAQARRGASRLFGTTGERVGEQIVQSIRGTIDGLVLVGLGEGVAMGIGYVIAGVPHPILLGSITAIAAMIPFGAAILIGIAALLLLAKGAVIAALAIVILGVIVVGVADHFVRPLLIGGATRLPFLWVLIGILGGVEAFGLLGLFIGPAVMAALILLWREFVSAPA